MSNASVDLKVINRAEREESDAEGNRPRKTRTKKTEPSRAVSSNANVSTEPPEPLWGGINPQTIDRQVHAALARMTFGLSPASFMEAYGDWAVHLATSPGTQAKLVQKAVRKAIRLWLYAARCTTESETSPCIEPLPRDKRFVAPEWQT